jgi:hypothetical protein
MENKYFTPDIEDIRVGFVAEWLQEIDTPSEYWELKTLQHYNLTTAARSLALIKKPTVRVLYLTKEQIEAEGWELIQIYPKGACIFQKGTKEEGCELTCDFIEHKVHFTKLYFYGLDDEYTRTKLTWNSLECKDINTFRKIIKLLGI